MAGPGGISPGTLRRTPTGPRRSGTAGRRRPSRRTPLPRRVDHHRAAEVGGAHVDNGDAVFGPGAGSDRPSGAHARPAPKPVRHYRRPPTAQIPGNGGAAARKSLGEGKRVSVMVDHGG